MTNAERLADALRVDHGTAGGNTMTDNPLTERQLQVLKERFFPDYAGLEYVTEDVGGVPTTKLCKINGAQTSSDGDWQFWPELVTYDDIRPLVEGMTGEELDEYWSQLVGHDNQFQGLSDFKAIHLPPIPVILHALAAVYCKEGK